LGNSSCQLRCPIPVRPCAVRELIIKHTRHDGVFLWRGKTTLDRLVPSANDGRMVGLVHTRRRGILRIPVLLASLGGFYNKAKRLAGEHPDHINSRGGLLITPLMAALHGKHSYVADLLHRHGADLDVPDSGGHTSLYEACRTGALEPQILHSGCSNTGQYMNAQCCKRYTPLHVAAYNGSHQALQMLIAHDANIDIRTVHGKCPLHVAVSPNGST